MSQISPEKSLCATVYQYRFTKDWKILNLGRFCRSNRPLISDLYPVSCLQPASASSLRRYIAASLIQHHRSVDRNGHAYALQPVSPASYASSSFEVPPLSFLFYSNSLVLRASYCMSCVRLQQVLTGYTMCELCLTLSMWGELMCYICVVTTPFQ